MVENQPANPNDRIKGRKWEKKQEAGKVLPRPSRRLHARLKRIRGGNACSPLGLGLGAGECVSIRCLVSTLQPFKGMGGYGRYVLGKRPGQSLLAADFLATDEGVDGDGDGTVDILCGAVF